MILHFENLIKYIDNDEYEDRDKMRERLIFLLEQIKLAFELKHSRRYC